MADSDMEDAPSISFHQGRYLTQRPENSRKRRRDGSDEGTPRPAMAANDPFRSAKILDNTLQSRTLELERLLPSSHISASSGKYPHHHPILSRSSSSTPTLSQDSTMSDSDNKSDTSSNRFAQIYREYGSASEACRMDKVKSTEYNMSRSHEPRHGIPAPVAQRMGYLTNIEVERRKVEGSFALKQQFMRAAEITDQKQISPPSRASQSSVTGLGLVDPFGSLKVVKKETESAKNASHAKQDLLPPAKQSGLINYTISEDRTGGQSQSKSILLCALKQDVSLLDMAKAIASGKKSLGEVVTATGAKRPVILVGTKIYGCKTCKIHLALQDEIISRNFRGQHGKGYLFNIAVNLNFGESQERNMTTGRHIMTDVSCIICGEVMGWRYDKAFEASEKYKEGKWMLEAELLCIVT